MIARGGDCHRNGTSALGAFSLPAKNAERNSKRCKRTIRGWEEERVQWRVLKLRAPTGERLPFWYKGQSNSVNQAPGMRHQHEKLEILHRKSRTGRREVFWDQKRYLSCKGLA